MQEHLGDVVFIAERLGFALAALGDFCPHFLHSLQHHVQCLHMAQELHVVAVDEHSRVVLDHLEQGAWTHANLLLFLLPLLQLL